MERYVSEIAFPSYAFVPGRHPHPITDSRGHSFGDHHRVPDPLVPEHPMTSREFLIAIDLFNAGYYWEAHEAWEGLWIAAGRVGVVADFLKGLIKLAAAGVKSREGQAVGVQRHARRAAELFQSVIASRPMNSSPYAGLRLDDLISICKLIADMPVIDKTPSIGGLPVIPCRLTLCVP